MMNTIELTRHQLAHLLRDKLATHFTFDIYDDGKVQISSHIRSIDGITEGWLPASEDEHEYEPIIRAACEATMVTYAELIESRKANATTARSIISAQIYRHERHPLPLHRIAALLRRNHTTIMYFIRRFDNYLETDKEFKRTYERYVKSLKKYDI